MEIKIRSANPQDAERIACVHVDAWRAAYRDVMPRDFLAKLDKKQKTAYWNKSLSHQGIGKYIVAEYEGIVEGFAVFGPARDKNLTGKGAGELVALNVNPTLWGKGIGTATLQHVIEYFNQNSLKPVYLWVVKSNARAIELYKKHGFEDEGKSKIDNSHSGSPINEIRLILTSN